MPSEARERTGKRREPAVLLRASLRGVRGAGVGVPVVAALVLVASTFAVTESYGSPLLLAVTVILGFALQAAVDDPERSILAAAPCALPRRTLSRVAAAGSFTLPVWLLAAAVTRWHLAATPVPALVLQTATLWVVGVVVAMSAWRASDSPHPSYIAAPVLLAMVLVGTLLPPQWRMFDAQQWGPPWLAAQLRWCAVFSASVGVLALLLTDPMTSRRARAEGV